MGSEFQTVGVVGTGAMGSVFVERFIAEGVKVFVYDVVPAAVERAVGLGATACSTPAELAARCDLVDVMVWDDEQALRVCLGEGGILETLGASKPLLLNSSIRPATTKVIAEAAAKKGVPVADACIASIPDLLRNRDAAALVGGDEALFERVKPHLERLCKDIFYMGPLGCGNVAKGAYNTVAIAPELLRRECLEIMVASGISSERAKAMIQRELDAPSLVLMFDDETRAGFCSGIAGNLFDPILPITVQAADELGVKAPFVHLLASAKQPLD